MKDSDARSLLSLCASEDVVDYFESCSCWYDDFQCADQQAIKAQRFSFIWHL